jgi:hypothetical protein
MKGTIYTNRLDYIFYLLSLRCRQSVPRLQVFFVLSNMTTDKPSFLPFQDLTTFNTYSVSVRGIKAPQLNARSAQLYFEE